jgi:Bacterial type II and III secretion system protein
VRWQPYLLLALTLCAINPARAERMVLEVIELQHRLVRDVLPVIQPVLAPGSTATGTASQLIIRTTPENLAEIRQLIEAIDTRIKQLKIFITQDLSAVAQHRGDALSGHVHAGDFTAGVADPGPPGGAAVSIEGERGAVSYQTHRTQTQEDSSNLHFVVGMDGQPAYLETGQQIPQPYYQSATPYDGSVSGGIEYQTVASGIYVTPHVQGENVMLEVSPQLARADPYGSGAIATHRAETTVSGRLGEWIALGGTTHSASETDAELLARTRRHSDNSYTVWIKVEEIP